MLECKVSFSEFKRYLSKPLILSKPKTDHQLYLYLSISNVAVASTLVREDTGQHLVYFVSKML